MPADYVNKLARMFQDIKVSEDLNQSFKEMHKHNKLALPGKKQQFGFYLLLLQLLVEQQLVKVDFLTLVLLCEGELDLLVQVACSFDHL